MRLPFADRGIAVALAEHDAADADDQRRDEELDLEEGALDPDELVGDPLVWDEGADDEVD